MQQQLMDMADRALDQVLTEKKKPFVNPYTLKIKDMLKRQYDGTTWIELLK